MSDTMPRLTSETRGDLAYISLPCGRVVSTCPLSQVGPQLSRLQGIYDAGYRAAGHDFEAMRRHFTAWAAASIRVEQRLHDKAKCDQPASPSQCAAMADELGVPVAAMGAVRRMDERSKNDE